MKPKNSLLIIAIIILAACKKDRVCSCTMTKMGTSTTTAKGNLSLLPGISIKLADTSYSSNILEVQQIDKTMEKVTKKRAKNNCISYTEPFSETIPTSVPSTSFNLSITVTNKGEKHYDCELK